VIPGGLWVVWIKRNYDNGDKTLGQQYPTAATCMLDNGLVEWTRLD